MSVTLSLWVRAVKQNIALFAASAKSRAASPAQLRHSRAYSRAAVPKK